MRRSPMIMRADRDISGKRTLTTCTRWRLPSPGCNNKTSKALFPTRPGPNSSFGFLRSRVGNLTLCLRIQDATVVDHRSCRSSEPAADPCQIPNRETRRTPGMFQSVPRAGRRQALLCAGRFGPMTDGSDLRRCHSKKKGQSLSCSSSR